MLFCLLTLKIDHILSLISHNWKCDQRAHCSSSYQDVEASKEGRWFVNGVPEKKKNKNKEKQNNCFVKIQVQHVI